MNPLVMVTGATGFVGQALCARLIERGYNIRAPHVEAAAPRQGGGAIDWIPIDPIGPDSDWSEILEGANYVVHLAGLAHAGAESSSTQDLFRVNCDATRTLAVACAAKVQRFVFMSSIGAVATTCNEPIDESTTPAPDSAYGQSKYEAELAVRQAFANRPDGYTILRPTLIYGPSNPGNMQRLLKLVDLGIPLPLGSLRNRRSFCYLGNAVDAIVTVLTSPNAGGETFTLCDSEVVSTPQLLGLLASAQGRSPRLWPFPTAGIDMAVRICDRLQQRITPSRSPSCSAMWGKLSGSLWASNLKLRQMCNWSPPYSIEQGIEQTLGLRRSSNGSR